MTCRRIRNPALQRRPHSDRPKKRDVNGWIILDKGVGMTSTHAVAVVKRGLTAKKAGHAGTLDPLASGILPIALGEATKTVPFIMDGRKSYVFTVAWGEETNTDDAEGEVVARAICARRRGHRGALPRFIGRSSAGAAALFRHQDRRRARLRSRAGRRGGRTAAREVVIDRLARGHTPTTATFGGECGKGTYVRAIARDLGRALGCLGHIAALRRTRVGPFTEATRSLAWIEARRTDPRPCSRWRRPARTPLHRRQPRHGGAG